VNVARSPEEADLQAQGIDVMAQMFERDAAPIIDEEPATEEAEPTDAAEALEAPAADTATADEAPAAEDSDQEA